MRTTTKNRAASKLADEAWRRLAAAQLGIAAEAPLEELRAAALARLEQEDFVPPPELRQAFEYLAAEKTPASGPVPAELVDVFERSLRAEIDDFIASFFQLPVPDRCERWERLLIQAPRFPALLARLKQLEPGLKADCAVLAPLDSTRRGLAERACGLFLLPTSARTVECESLLEEMSAEKAIWQPAARALKRKAPEFVRLVPRLIEGIPLPRIRRGAVTPKTRSYPVSPGNMHVPWWFVGVLAASVLASVNLFREQKGGERVIRSFPKGVPPSEKVQNKLFEDFKRGQEARDLGASPLRGPDAAGVWPDESGAPQSSDEAIRRGQEIAAEIIAARRARAAAEAPAKKPAAPRPPGKSDLERELSEDALP